MVLAAIGVAAVDHHGGLQAGFCFQPGDALHVSRAVVGNAAAAAQNQMAIGVAVGGEDGRLAVLGVAKEGVRLARGEDGFDGDSGIAGGAVLEADRTGKAADKLAVKLAFRGARADGAPADECGEILRRDEVEEFAAGGNAHLGEIEEKIARHAQAIVDAMRLVEVRIVDQALPANRGARLLEIDAHDDEQVLRQFGSDGFQQARVFESSIGVVDRTGADHDEQAAVSETEDFEDLLARLVDEAGGGIADGALRFKSKRWVDYIGGADPKIVNDVLHGDDRTGHGERSLNCSCPQSAQRCSPSFRLASMKAAIRSVILLTLAAAAGAGAACAQAKSGLYGNLTLGVDGTTVTGVFSDARAGNGTEDAPQFSCQFVLSGTSGSEANGAFKVTVWSPPDVATTSGTLSFDKDTAKLRLEGDPPGCSATGDEFVSAAYEEPSVMDGKWTSVRLVSVASAEVREAPVDGSSARTRLKKGDVVVIYRRIGTWLEGENLNARRAVRGWLREMDLAPNHP